MGLPGLVPEHNRCLPTVDPHHYAIPHRWLIHYLLPSIDITSGTGQNQSGIRRSPTTWWAPHQEKPIKKMYLNIRHWNRLHSMVGVVYSQLHLRYNFPSTIGGVRIYIYIYIYALLGPEKHFDVQYLLMTTSKQILLPRRLALIFSFWQNFAFSWPEKYNFDLFHGNY